MNTISRKSHLKLWFVGVALVLLVLCRQSAEAQATNTFPTTGNAGVGTVTPAYPLQVEGPSTDPLFSQAYFKNTSSTYPYGGIAVDGVNQSHIRFLLGGALKWQWRVGAGTGVDDLRAYNWTLGSDVLTLKNNGNVGVGTVSPVYSLDVNGGTNAFRTKASTSSANDTIATFESASGIQAIVRANGYIGIGVTSPSQKLQIGSNTTTGTGTPDAISLGATYSTTARSNPKLRLFDDNGAGLYGLGVSDHQMDFMIPSSARYVWSVNGVEKMRLDDLGNITVSGNLSAKYQDMAEWVESSQTLTPGTVVVLDETRSNQVIASTQAYDTRVAGVISLQPGITLGEKGESKVLVATTGRVKVKVVTLGSPIRIGDLLVTSDTPGVAMRSEPITIGGRKIHSPGTLIGKALEPLEKGSGEILVLLSLQ